MIGAGIALAFVQGVHRPLDNLICAGLRLGFRLGFRLGLRLGGS